MDQSVPPTPQPNADSITMDRRFLNRHPWMMWIPAFVGLFIGMLVGGGLFDAKDKEPKVIRETIVVTATPAPMPSPAIQVVSTLPPPTFFPLPTAVAASPAPTFMKACTMEAKLCPDGSSVGRSGPNCEFAPCKPMP